MELVEVHDLFAYDSWANELLLTALSELEDQALARELGTSHGSLLGTFVHLIAAEEIWLSRWKGSPRSKLTAVDEVPGLLALRAFWERVRDERGEFLRSLSEADLDREIEMPTTSGKTYRHSFADMFRHLVNHSAYHRGQLATMLRQMGVKPPATDLIRYYREVR